MSQVSPNLMQLMQTGGTGNPLLDMYASQYGAYAALAAAPTAASPAAATVSQAGVMPAVSQSLSLDASQAQAQANAAAVAGERRKMKSLNTFKHESNLYSKTDVG